MTSVDIATVWRDVYYASLIVGTLVVAGLWLLLPRRNGSLTRSFRRLFASMTGIFVYGVLFRTGGFNEVALSADWQYVLGIIVFGFFNLAGPPALIAARKARTDYRSEVVRLAAATKASAKETEVLARRAKEAAADEAVTGGDA